MLTANTAGDNDFLIRCIRSIEATWIWYEKGKTSGKRHEQGSYIVWSVFEPDADIEDVLSFFGTPDDFTGPVEVKVGKHRLLAKQRVTKRDE